MDNLDLPLLAVRLKSLEEESVLIRALQEMGYTWRTGEELSTAFSCWSVYRDNTYIALRRDNTFFYGDINGKYLEREAEKSFEGNVVILSLEEFLNYKMHVFVS